MTATSTPGGARTGPVVVVGLGVSGRAVVRQLKAEGVDVVAVDDDGGPAVGRAAAELDVELVRTPAPAALRQLLHDAAEVVVSPGVPACHRVFSCAGETPVIGEVELGWRRSRVPVVAVTGTNGKTTVVTLVTAMLRASGLDAVAAGNIGLPLVEAAAGPAQVLVVEVSSFQLALTQRFRPAIGAWLNFSPDHLDWHPSIDHYRRSKARLWANSGHGDVAVVNLDDPVVVAAGELPSRRGATTVSFGLHQGEWCVVDRQLVGPDGQVARLDELPRHLPHDLVNAACAAATAIAAGASAEACRSTLLSFSGLPHRMELVGQAEGVQFYDDSKATTPGAVLAAISGFDSVVLIAGGRNKGLDLTALRQAAPKLRRVVAIGEAAPQIVAAMEGSVPVVEAPTMAEAVGLAAAGARAGDVVLLSPGCASFDWYRSYAERGDDFARCVADLGIPR